MSRARVTETVPGAFVVTYSYTEKRGARNVTIGGTITVDDTTPEGARAVARSRRDHLPAFRVVSVEPRTETRPMTRAEELAAGLVAFEALLAKRAG